MDIKKTNQIEHHHIFALIIGTFGIGKTSLASTLKPTSKTLILSAESGLLALHGHDIDFVEIKNLEDLITTYKTLKEGTEYKNIFIDSLTEISEKIFNDLSLRPEHSKGGFAIYKDYSTKILNVLKAFRDLTEYDIYMTCLEKQITEDYQEVVSIDMVQKSLNKKVPALFDLVLHMKILPNKDGEATRVLCCDQTTSPLAKDRSGKLEPYEKPNLQDINNKIFNKGVKDV